jgi:hypothetical protein
MAKKFSKPRHEGNKASGIGSNKKAETYDDLVKFSFKYLDTTNSKFDFSSKESTYFLKFIERLKGISTSTVSRLCSSYDKRDTLRFHDIDWARSSEKCFGIPKEDEIVDKPWQFAISVNEHGRVHGFFIGNVFNIVWFDPNHELC